MMPKLLLDSAKTTAIVMFMIAGAYLYGWVITNDQIPQKLVVFVSAYTTNPQIILLFLVLVYFVTGMFMDLGASIILLCPIFFPLIQALGIDPMFSMIYHSYVFSNRTRDSSCGCVSLCCLKNRGCSYSKRS